LQQVEALAVVLPQARFLTEIEGMATGMETGIRGRWRRAWRPAAMDDVSGHATGMHGVDDNGHQRTYGLSTRFWSSELIYLDSDASTLLAGGECKGTGAQQYAAISIGRSATASGPPSHCANLCSGRQRGTTLLGAVQARKGSGARATLPSSDRPCRRTLQNSNGRRMVRRKNPYLPVRSMGITPSRHHCRHPNRLLNRKVLAAHSSTSQCTRQTLPVHFMFTGQEMITSCCAPQDRQGSGRDTAQET